MGAAVAGGRIVRADPSLWADVRRYGPFDRACLNCGGCTLVCELGQGDITFPRRPIHRVLAGLRQPAPEALEPWLCHDCGDCTVACPRQADPATSLRTLRAWLTAQYDWTGLSARVLRSRAWHLGALGAVAPLSVALLFAYHLRWAGLAAEEFVSTPMGFEHMFPGILYFTWTVYLLAATLIASHAWRMYRVTRGADGPPGSGWPRCRAQPRPRDAGFALPQDIARNTMRRVGLQWSVLYLGGTMAATLAGFVVDGLLDGHVSAGAGILISLVVSTIVYYWAYRFLKGLRDG
jgi:ferredoxin